MIAPTLRAHKVRRSVVESVGQRRESDQVKPFRSLAIRSIASLSTLLVLLVVASELAEARYIHSTYRVTPAVYDGQQPRLQEQTSGFGASEPQMSRRQDYEGDDADEAEDGEDDDQRAAASYRNQDDTSGGGGGGGGDGANSGSDSYGDNEPDGPYEETPVEQEGQADLERFFDDHLGASDRDGMDQENLPTNVIQTRSGLPLDSVGLPINQYIPSGAAPVVSPVVSAAEPLRQPVQTPINIRSRRASDSLSEQLSSSPTVQTSFIRLPDEKMIITRQVTAARNLPRGPLKIDTDSSDSGRSSNAAASLKANGNLAPGQTNISAANEQAANATAERGLISPFSSQLFGLRISPTEALPPGLMQPGGLSSAASERPKARGVVSTEDEDFEPVYVTSETNKPFEIDALGGFDPEADFNDAARELEVDVGDGLTRRTTLKRRASQQEPGGAGTENTNSRLTNNGEPNQQGDDQQNLQEIIFGDPDSDKMYEDASETDEVTFDQDDPYQTDLEAEMRQQELDRLQSLLRAGQAREQPNDRADSMNVVVDDGLNGNQAHNKDQAAASASDNDDDDIDADIDNEYRPEPSSSRARNSITGTASAAPNLNGAGRGDTDDEGAWINDGADEMEVPSQSHQNSVLDRAEDQQNKAAAANAEAAKAAAAASEQVADEPNDKQSPDGGGDGRTDESGQTNEDGVENIRMPNADYLKNDLVDDDSGYAA